MPEPSPTRRRLAQELQRLRDVAGLSGREMARRTGVSQPMLSRIDRGLALPALSVVRQWLDECAADRDIRVRVLALAEAALAETKPWRTLLEEEGHTQRQIRDLDRSAARIRNFQPTVLPGLLQTAAYARAVFQRGRTTDIPAAVAGRLERQQILHEDGREFQFVVTEGVLRWSPGPGTLAGQADRLLSLATLGNVEIAVLPDSADPGVVLWNNFVIREPVDPAESTTVSVELQHGSHDVADPDSVQLYEQIWDSVWKAAAHGGAAVALIEASARSDRSAAVE